MKKQCKPLFFISMTALAIFNLLCYFSIRSMWSGIIRYTFDAMPYLLLLGIFVTAMGMVILTMLGRYPRFPAFIATTVNILFLGLDAYIISLTTEASHYFIREFLYGVAFLGGLGVILFLWFYLPKEPWFRKKWMPSLMLLLLFIGGIIWKFDLSFSNGFVSIPVVYAVEDTYQIVFTTKAKGEAWITINGVEYNDTFAGYRYTESTIHKVTVPMKALDNAGEYTLYTRAMYLRGPYCSLQGKTLSETHTWKGVDTSDGLNYYVLADTHNTQKTPLAAANYFGEYLDFLISVGDNVSWIDREEDLLNFHTLAGNITKGEIPVIYARGNHETKGIMAKDFHRYVGSKDGNYYYTFRLQNIWGIVLDIGEDHGDDFVEYCGISKFDQYRKEQTAFLDQVLFHSGREFDAPGIDYRIAVCHIPLTVKNQDDYVADIKDQWVERLNQMKLTIMYSGHQHELWFIDENFEAGSTLTNVEEYSGKSENNKQRIMTAATFPTILVSKRGESQSLLDKEKVFDTGFIGVAASVNDTETVLQYTNEDMEVLTDIRSPWFSDIIYGEEIRVNNIK